MNHIDISSVLRQTLACDLYSNLVTRSTGAAVRDQIELLLGESHDRGVVLTVIDFSHVSMIDFSCADEVVAKLLMRYASDTPPQDAFFLFRGVSGDDWPLKLIVASRPLSLVTLTRYLNEVVAVPRNAGKFVVNFSFAGNSSPMVRVMGNFSSRCPPFACTVKR